MAKIIEYITGERYFQSEMISLSIHGGSIQREIDLTQATPLERTQLAINPYDDVLIDQIVQRSI